MQRAFSGIFADIDEMGERIGWQLSFRQLEAGPLVASVDLLQSRTFSLMRVNFNRRFHQTGSAIPGMKTFGILQENSPVIDWCGTKLTGGDIVDFNQRNGFDGVSHAGHSAYTFSLDDDLLYARAREQGVQIESPPNEESAGKLAKPGRGLWSLLGHYFDSLQPSDHQLVGRARKIAVAELEDALCTIVLRQGGEQPEPLQSVPTWSSRQKVCRRAVAYLDAHIERPVRVGELCQAASVSLATLERAFKGYFGVGPKRYIAYRRLAAVARALKLAEDESVTEVASRWGYWHMGQFSRDFRQFTGVLPSRVKSVAV